MGKSESYTNMFPHYSELLFSQDSRASRYFQAGYTIVGFYQGGYFGLHDVLFSTLRADLEYYFQCMVSWFVMSAGLCETKFWTCQLR